MWHTDKRDGKKVSDKEENEGQHSHMDLWVTDIQMSMRGKHKNISHWRLPLWHKHTSLSCRHVLSFTPLQVASEPRAGPSALSDEARSSRDHLNNSPVMQPQQEEDPGDAEFSSKTVVFCFLQTDALSLCPIWPFNPPPSTHPTWRLLVCNSTRSCYSRAGSCWPSHRGQRLTSCQKNRR